MDPGSSEMSDTVRVGGAAICVVDDDPEIRRLLKTAFNRAGYAVICFADGESLLKGIRLATPLCIMLDVHIPGKSGMDVLEQLSRQGCSAPVFMISGAGDIAMAVASMKHGALDFIEKPFRPSEVVERVRAAIEDYKKHGARIRSEITRLHFPGREPLTKREGEVLQQITSGHSNKEVARTLGLSPRTVELHRARLMQKLNAKNTADLVRIALSEPANASA